MPLAFVNAHNIFVMSQLHAEFFTLVSFHVFFMRLGLRIDDFVLMEAISNQETRSPNNIFLLFLRFFFHIRRCKKRRNGCVQLQIIYRQFRIRFLCWKAWFVFFQRNLKLMTMCLGKINDDVLRLVRFTFFSAFCHFKLWFLSFFVAKRLFFSWTKNAFLWFIFRRKHRLIVCNLVLCTFGWPAKPFFMTHEDKERTKNSEINDDYLQWTWSKLMQTENPFSVEKKSLRH